MVNYVLTSMLSACSLQFRVQLAVLPLEDHSPQFAENTNLVTKRIDN
jgi:hypothetical protein